MLRCRDERVARKMAEDCGSRYGLSVFAHADGGEAWLIGTNDELAAAGVPSSRDPKERIAVLPNSSLAWTFMRAIDHAGGMAGYPFCDEKDRIAVRYFAAPNEGAHEHLVALHLGEVVL